MDKFLDNAGISYLWNKIEKKFANNASLATSLQAITIYTDNTAAHKAANLANIKAYEDNLKAMGTTTTKDHIIPIAIYGTIQKGFLNGNTSSNIYQGMMGQDNQCNNCVVANDGTFASIPILTGYISQLNTTAKTSVISAINEVSTLATRKATLAQDGVVRVELKDATSNYGQLQSSYSPKVKLARDKNGVLAVGTASKQYYGAVKIGDGLNVSGEGVVSVSTATTSANGLMSSADKTKLDGALAAIANNASVNAMDIVSYDEQTGTYSGNSINLNGNDIKTESAITVSGTTIAANTTMDTALKTVLTVAKNAASDALYAKEHGVKEINGSSDSVVNFATSVSEPGDVEFNVTSNDGTTTDITAKVNGLGSAAYRDDNYFATYSQGVAGSTALQSVNTSIDSYINAVAEKKEGTSQTISISANVSTDISSVEDEGALADAYAVKQYVDSKTTGDSDMITIIYNDDDSSLTTTEITDAQFKAITDAINASISPNIQAAYISGGEYNYMPLCYQFNNQYSFGSIYYDLTSIRYTSFFFVNVTIDYASSNGKHAVNITSDGADFGTIAASVARETNVGTTTIASTSGSANLPNKSGKYAITATQGSYTLTLPASPSDGVTYEIYKYKSGPTLTIASTKSNIYVCDTESTVSSKTYQSRNGKITATYFNSQSKWVVMRTDFGQ